MYILKCNDGTHYVGCTGDFEERIIQHTKGYVQYTKTRLPVKTVIKIEFFDKYKAYQFEKYLKSGSGRAFMYKRLI
ncbi:GIY-YIG nuclease family protein [Aquimarina brevivitae]|uniref:GIY-YIG catalytic domain-containing protein n=1 Tax=Aquimarina brevivitae TaxID=323412 RepID=A0A4Q7PI08_9FLAO|nr:GIY-YIG nuclease family protein [Aquimarina brevivitae]RZT00195.1 GIY-YIG catalytic domain-containing protein [Aquimarina brevivitae]